jgi:hypothetical protein
MTVVTFIVSIVAIIISVGALYAQFAGLGLDKKLAKFAQSGKPTVSILPSPSGTPPRSYVFEVFNAGQAALSDLYAQLHDSQHQDVADEDTYVGPLEPFGRRSFTRTVRDTRQSANPLHIHLTWYDASEPAGRSIVSKVAVPY